MQKILVAEDSPVDALVIRNVLRRAGYELVFADSGASALEALELEENQDLQLLLADINMPGMGGIELVEKLREGSKWAGIPVIFLTAVANAEIVRSAVGLGSVGYVLKPLREPSRLLRVVADALEGAPALRR